MVVSELLTTMTSLVTPAEPDLPFRLLLADALRDDILGSKYPHCLHKWIPVLSLGLLDVADPRERRVMDLCEGACANDTRGMELLLDALDPQHPMNEAFASQMELYALMTTPSHHRVRDVLERMSTSAACSHRGRAVVVYCHLRALVLTPPTPTYTLLRRDALRPPPRPPAKPRAPSDHGLSDRTPQRNAAPPAGRSGGGDGARTFRPVARVEAA